jgi:hypothetical protein
VDLDEKGWDGLGLAVGAAFYRGVQRRFRVGSTKAEVISFVAEARTDVVGTGYDIDPTTGEALIRSAITGETEAIESFNARAVVETEMLLLWKLLGPLSDEELADFFGDADRLAEGWCQQT